MANTSMGEQVLYTGDLARTSATRSLNANAPLWQRLEAPENYAPDADLVDAVNVALRLGQPLLVTGEPGCGKTRLAYSIAEELHLRFPDQFHDTLLRFETKSTSVASDLFYVFDALGRLYAAKDGVEASADPLTYLSWSALGEAIILAADDITIPDKIQQMTGKSGVKRSVVLIDEIDKASRDLPNDLLNEIASMRFSVREMEQLEIAADRSRAPVVIITSNSEKMLPDPFLRRCVFHDIRFPIERIGEIAARTLALPGGEDNPFLKDAVSLFTEFRNDRHHLEKKPGLHEFMSWAEVTTILGGTNTDPIRASSTAARRALSALFKSKHDIAKGRDTLDAWIANLQGT